MIYSVPASVPICPPLQLTRQSNGHLSFRSRGDGETVLFLHGLLGSSKSWAFQFDRLSRDYRMIAWDAPGYGQSGMVSASIEAFVEALREFIANIGRAKVSLVGHSMGGTVAACFAATFPELVSRLVLSCSHAGYGDPDVEDLEEAMGSGSFDRRSPRDEPEQTPRSGRSGGAVGGTPAGKRTRGDRPPSKG